MQRCSRACVLRFSAPLFVPRRVISVRTSPYRKFVSCTEICSYRERRARQKRPGESCLMFPCFEPRLIAASKISPRRLSFSSSFFFFLPWNKKHRICFNFSNFGWRDEGKKLRMCIFIGNDLSLSITYSECFQYFSFTSFSESPSSWRSCY